MKSMSLPQLPRSQTVRLDRVRRALEVERRSPAEFHGRPLRRARHLISIPLGRRWRALFVKTPLGYEFRDCLTHERYNKLNLAAYLP